MTFRFRRRGVNDFAEKTEPALDSQSNERYHNQANNPFMHPSYASNATNSYTPQAVPGGENQYAFSNGGDIGRANYPFQPDANFYPSHENQRFQQQHDQASFHPGQHPLQNAGSSFKILSPVKLLVQGSGVLILATLFWFAYRWATSTDTQYPYQVPPVTNTYRVTPKIKGGIDIPYQNHMIYNRLDGRNEDSARVKLAPVPEKPEPRVEDNTSDNLSHGKQAYEKPSEYANKRTPDQPQKSSYQAENLVPTLEDLQREQLKSIKAIPDNESMAVAKPHDEFYVQLATVSTEEDAIKEWHRLKKRYNLKSVQSQVREFVTSGGITIYRLLMGPFNNHQTAIPFARKISGSKVVRVTAE